MQHDFDVIVAGGGPAGATLARGLARQHARVALIEKQRLPRYKSCAGGIPMRTAAMLDFPIDSVVEDAVGGLDITYLGRWGFQRRARSPIAQMVMRDRFDALLVERAAEAGVEVIDGTAIADVRQVDGGFAVASGGTVPRRWSARYVAGADGANSIVSRRLGLGRGMYENVALELEVAAPQAARDRWRSLINLDVGYRPWGYAWIFPKAEHLSIGLVLPEGGGASIRRDAAGYLARLGLGDARIMKRTGHKIPTRRGHEAIAAGGAILLGDAAGLTDEFTEEGIVYAIQSGLIAQREIGAALAAGRPSLAAYERAVDREIMPEIRAARTVARLFYSSLRASPWLTFRFSRRVGYLWHALFRILRGESSYHAELQRWPFLPAIAATVLRRAGP